MSRKEEALAAIRSVRPPSENALRRLVRGNALAGAAVGRFDFAIIGAGAAGLAAAVVLSRAGASVCLLEARPRIGGRVWTHRRPGRPAIELGAEFVHGRSEALFAEAASAGLSVVRLPDTHVERRGGQWRPLLGMWQRVDSMLRRIPSAGADRSVADHLRRRKRTLKIADRRLLVSFVEGYDAAPVAAASAKALSRAGEPPTTEEAIAQFRLAGGWGGFLDWLAREIDPAHCRIALSTPVRHVRWKRGDVRLSSAAGSVRAKAALFTLPVGVLNARPESEGSVGFDPEPPGLARAAAGLAMGDVVRLVLEFRREFWRSRSGSRLPFDDRQRGPTAFLHLADTAFPTWWTTAPVESATLVAWGGGPPAQSLLGRPKVEIVSRALQTLADALEIPVRRTWRELSDWHSHDWSADPFSRGAYSYARVGGASSGRRLAEPIARTLYFAGEAVGAGESGTVPAAIESGRHAARRMLR